MSLALDSETQVAVAGRFALYRQMLRIRIIEEWIADHYAEEEMRCPVHLSIGQEAVAVGVCAMLRRADKVVSNHRAHAHYLAKGGDLHAMMAEIYGKAAGTCGGRGGSMHLFDNEAGLLLSLPIVGSSIPIGVGAALAFRQERRDNVAVAFFGDGAIEEGAFHESANFAVLKSLPVLFVCENNLFSVYTRLDERQPRRPITDLAKAHAMPVVHGDGNDAIEVARLTAEAVASARRGQGPTFLLFDTYRWREHCGPDYDDDIGYRTPEEAAEWRELCPVTRLHQELVAGGTLTEEANAALIAEIEAEIAAAIAFAKTAPFPEPTTAMDHVYAG
jgi:TPP-dependent pyruvate/acetoin dehydrogenase alpha subunit